ncbi:hypothetical protein KFL_005440070 [Klebsormidium nitens]|uniref:Transmembrane protein n=1 Tax=Klebsormidium nitens TaxID=105231 RepID=A0A1Y1IJK2_KLENI|nr:hypothetical protein KFL_005440070 [Klebsormidium nitens]|eukprot:GAQ89629.1 hypothetical protein KFL_005440070 [Klebsormidium nitens]
MNFMDFPVPGQVFSSPHVARPHRLPPERLAQMTIPSILVLLLLGAFTLSRLPASIQRFCREAVSDSIFFDFASDVLNAEAVRRRNGDPWDTGMVTREVAAIRTEEPSDFASAAAEKQAPAAATPLQPTTTDATVLIVFLIVLCSIAAVMCLWCCVLGLYSRFRQHKRSKKLFPERDELPAAAC